MNKFKHVFFAIPLVALAFGFTSCSNDDEDAPAPIITFDAKDGVEVDNGTAITGKVTSVSNLDEVRFFIVKGNDTEQVGVPVTKFDDKTTYTFRYELKGVDDKVTAVKITAKNKENKIAEKTLTVKVKVAVVPETALSAAAEFKLYNPASGDTKPKTVNGVSYEKNTDATTAQFTGSFVMLADKAAYDKITTKEGLAKAFNDGAKATSFTAQSDTKFTAKYFIVSANSVVYLVEMKALNFVAGANTATFTEKH